MNSVHSHHHLALLVMLSMIILLRCAPAPVEPTKPVLPTLILPTPTPLPPTPTPTPLPEVTTGTVFQGMTEKRETLSIEEIDNLLIGFLPTHTRSSQYPVDTYRIWFQTRNEDDVVIQIQAEVRFPRVEGDVEEFPVFVYGPGTTGIATKCAPLEEQARGYNWGDYRSHLLSYATQGYITIIANWQGFDDPDRTHPYFVAELEGRVMLDAARAVYDFFEHPPSDDIFARPAPAIFLGGYSQGGHGAFSADIMAADYAPELDIKGIIGHATAPDVEGLMYDSPRYTPYIVYAYRDFYGDQVVSLQDVLSQNWISTFEQDVTSLCIDDAFNYYANTPEQMFAPEFRNALYSNQLADQFPAFKEKLDANYSGRVVNASVPAIILHGDADPIVQLHTINKFVSEMCQAGKSVTYNVYPGVDHFQTRQYSFVDTLQWMEGILGGNTPVSDCVIVDNADEVFIRSESKHWYEAPYYYGYRGHTYWTWTVSEEQEEDCWAEWRPVLPQPGLYEVFAFVPRQYAATHSARYQITHRRGVDVVTVDQSLYYDEWVSLGAYAFSTVQPGYVRLSDVTGEPCIPPQCTQIAFDAVMWVLNQPEEE